MAQTATTELPAWLGDYREGQFEIIEQVADAFTQSSVVILDAPTGTGKTLIAESVRQILDVPKTLYLATTLGLQQQFLRDFPYARLIMGRSNYPTANYPDAFPNITAEDCDKQEQNDVLVCSRCDPWFTCPYEQAKRKALGGSLVVANTSYFLHEANHAGRFSKRDFIIVDEADRLEEALLSFIEITLSSKRLDQLGIGRPSRITVASAWAQWLSEEALPAIDDAVAELPEQTADLKLTRKRKGLVRLQQQLSRVNLEDGNWVFAPMGDDDVRFKPVHVSALAPELVFAHGARFLLMSATVISADHMASTLGLTDYTYIPAPSTFPPSRRPILVRAAGDMSNKARQWEGAAKELQLILDAHPNDRILVHTVSFRLAAFLAESLHSPRVLTYRAGERDRILSKFTKTPAAVLIAASLDRGVDLPHDACRVVVVAKVPFPDLSDRQISARLHQRGGDLDYAVNTVRTLVQMTGRGMRSREDWCVSYILDTQFVSNVWRRSRQLLPVWWKEAIQWHAKTVTIE